MSATSVTRATLPDWLLEYSAQAVAPQAEQVLAWQQAKQWGLPTQRDEEWRWTNVRSLARLDLNTSAVQDSAPVLAEVLPNALVLRFVAGKLVQQPEVYPEGMTVTPLNVADEVVRSGASAKNANDAFVALNTAHAESGVVIEIADNTVIKPALILDWQDDGAAYMATRVVVRIGKSSEFTLIDVAHAQGTNNSWRNNVWLIEQAENSRLTHINLGLEGEKRMLTDRQFVQLQRDAHYCSINVQLDGQLARREIDVDIVGTGAHCDLYGLMMPRHKQVFDTVTRLRHGAPYTTSNESYQLIVNDAARGIFKGRILVAQDAQKIEAYQNSRNLLLSPNAEIDAKPELEIYADDVKCSHGTTIGQLDEETLYYLRSRGISESVARSLLVTGFAQEILSKLPISELKDWLSDKVGEMLNRVEGTR